MSQSVRQSIEDELQTQAACFCRVHGARNCHTVIYLTLFLCVRHPNKIYTPIYTSMR